MHTCPGLGPRQTHKHPVSLGTCSVAFRPQKGVGVHDLSISGLNNAARMLAVYASPPRSPATAQDSLPAA